MEQNTQIKVDDLPHQEMVQRGDELLVVLQRAARAARLEAQVTELQSALGDARGGEVTRLRNWLREFDAAPAEQATWEPPVDDRPARQRSPVVPLAYSRNVYPNKAPNNAPDNAIEQPLEDEQLDDDRGVDPARGATKTLETETPLTEEPLTEAPLTAKLQTETLGTGPAPKSQLLGWEYYLPLALERQRQANARALELPVLDDSCASSAPAAGPSDCLEELDDGFVEEAEEIDLPVESFDQLAGVATEHAPTAPSFSKRWLGGMGLSLAGHSGLLIVLGMMTYRPDREAASLGAQVLTAAEAPADIEVGQELELTEPVELPTSDPVANASSPEMSTDLSELQQTLDSSALDASALTSAAPSLSMASAVALAAGSGQPNRGRRSGTSSGGGRKGGAPKLGGQFFGVASGGNYFCYVVDSSGSMRGGAWESAKLELVRSLMSLRPTQRFYIVFFAKEVVAIPEPGSRERATHGLMATAENIEHARRWIDTVKLDSGGPPNDALAWAIERQPDAIYLLTDGVTKVDVCGHLRDINRVEDFLNGTQVRVPIHAIAYFSLDGQQLMRQLAQENKGQFHYVPEHP
ncbi:MAG: hypothetical protein IT423_01050 [Pirellulaceae bacterium]|nr:hypothetical protein [Pirellulaceae bacterium]